jgi:hypothetical protein
VGGEHAPFGTEDFDGRSHPSAEGLGRRTEDESKALELESHIAKLAHFTEPIDPSGKPVAALVQRPSGSL